MSWGLEDVSVRLGPTLALDGVDCTVAPGAVEAVIGPDGAGKSTLARTLVGLVAAERGQVRRPARDRLGYQPEAAGTWRDLTVAENLAFVVASRGRGTDLDARTTELLEVTDLAPAVDRLAGDLSGGMRQKLAVAMAMVARPDLLVLDEPTTGLDPISRADVWRLLARAAGEGAAIVVTTAYLDEAQRADHVVVLDHGRVLVAGTAREITASFPGRLVATDGRDPRRPSWRRGRTWRTWDRESVDPAPRTADPGVGTADPLADREPTLEPDLDDVVMAAAIARREDGS